MALPLLLAGPILRRVESNLVTVWLALSQEAQVTLSVWEGIVSVGAPNPLVSSDPKATLRLGDKLHLSLVTARLPETSGKIFRPDTLYSYDLTITVQEPSGQNVVHTLGTLNMLRDVKAKDSPDGIDHVALGYDEDVLPSFAPCPSQLTDVRIVYGSCRRPSHRDPDAMALIDDLITGRFDTEVSDRRNDPRARPHQLFLGGDQIYADDVDTLMMLNVMQLGIELIGTTPGPNPLGGPPLAKTPIEHVRVDKILKQTGSPQRNPADYHLAYTPDPDQGDDPMLPIDATTFPAGHRLELTKRAAKFTSSDGSSHVISLGEFAALYLLVWSNACWTPEIPGAMFVEEVDDDPEKPSPPTKPLSWGTKLTTKSRIVFPQLSYAKNYPAYAPTLPELPLRVSEHLFPTPDPKPKDPPKPDTRSADEKLEERIDAEKDRQRGLRRSHRRHAEFIAGLPRVRRVLANVPTYMILDDHDVTDDFFLSPTWRDRVLSTALGRTILDNGMLTYALFQDWGNDPKRYDTGLRAELLTRATELFPVGATKGPAKAPFERLAQLFGHAPEPGSTNEVRNVPDGVGGFRPVNPPIHWHFTIDAPTHRTIALDNRTRRSYPSRLGPPGNVSTDAMIDQIPLPPLLAGQELLVVIAPLQVIGPPVIDDIVAPLVYRVFDLFLAIGDEFDTSSRSLSGLRGMYGTNPDAIETWALDAPTFEQLLQRLEPYRRVVLLSGDVHNSAGAAMSYWRGDAEAPPARFVQFTSSGFKNVMPTMISAVDRAAGFAQQMVRANLGTERLGWEQPVEGMVVLPKDRTLADLVPNMRSRLVSTPVLLPTWGWPNDNDPRSVRGAPPNPNPTPEDPPPYDTTKETRLNDDVLPDWRWRVTALRDTRLDADRPEPIRPKEIDLDKVDRDLGSDDSVIDAYQAVAGRHQHALGHLRNARQIMFRSNVGLCRFQRNEQTGALEAVQEIYTAFTDPDQPAAEEPKTEAYMVHVATLDPDPEDRPPERLRKQAIEPRPPEVPPGG